MSTVYEIAALVAAVGAGLVAGLCFTFASFLMRSFDRLGAPQAIRAMQSLNAEILRSSAMVVWIGTAIVGGIVGLLAALGHGSIVGLVAGAVYGMGALLITGRGNVPLNEALDRVDPDSPEAEEAWTRYRTEWGRWNAMRTLLCAVASAGFALAL